MSRKDFLFMPTLAIPKLDTVDKKLITYLQEDFPLVLTPFRELGKRLSLTEKAVIERVKRLKSCGIIKRIGPIHNPQNLGYKRTLAGIRVPEERLGEVSRLVSSFEEVTHNYLRQDDTFNLWFTLICPTEKRINAILSEIKKKSGIKAMINLPTIRTIKIRTVFKV